MTAAPTPSFLRRTLRRRPATRRGRSSPRAAWTSDGLHPIEIVAPDAGRAALLLEYASPLFPTELVAGSELIVRLQPPSTGAGWVIELVSLVERWLESARLPCAKVLYGGRSYLICSSTHVAPLAPAAQATANTR